MSTAGEKLVVATAGRKVTFYILLYSIRRDSAIKELFLLFTAGRKVTF
jgi:hypothetical protein